MEYKKFSDIEHVLHRPGMYMGRVEMCSGERLVMENGRLNNIEMLVSDGLELIIVEVLSNAGD